MKSLMIAAAAAMAFVSGAQAVTFQPTIATAQATTGDGYVLQVGSSRVSAKARAQLQRVLRPHYTRIPITREMRAAAGDPNMTVIDRRSSGIFSSGEVNRCSFITMRGKRAMICES